MTSDVDFLRRLGQRMFSGRAIRLFTWFEIFTNRPKQWRYL